MLHPLVPLHVAIEHRRSQDFLWGCTFSSKILTTFLVVALETQAKTVKLTTPTLQIFSALQKSLNNLTFCCGVYLQLFSVA